MHSFRVGLIILARNMREGPCLRVGVVLHKVGPVTYEVGVNDQVWKCHADQLLEYKESEVPEISEVTKSSVVDVPVTPRDPTVSIPVTPELVISSPEVQNRYDYTTEDSRTSAASPAWNPPSLKDHLLRIHH